MRPIRPAARRPRAAVAAAAVLVAGGLAVTVASPASAATFTVDSGADAVDADPGDGTCETAAGECTLRAAVQQAQASGGPDTIVFADGVTSVTLTIAPAGEAADGSDDAATGDLDLDDVTIDGDGVSISNGDVADRLFHVEPGGTARLIGLELLGGTAPGAGSASGGGSGGAVLNAGSLTVENGRIADSTAVRAGGGIEASAGSETTVVGTLFEGNSTGTSPGNGGGIHITGGGTVTVEDSEFLANTAANEGGGVWNSAAATMTVIGSVFEGNVAAGAPAESGGGGLFNDGGTLVVEDSAVEGNSATGAAGSGGGVLNQGTLRMSGTAVVGNEAVRAGGGVESAPGGSGSTPTTETVTELDDVLLEGNTAGDAPGNGGGFHQTGAGTVSVTGSVVTGNSAAAEGGGLWNSAAATMTVRDTDVSDNVAEGTEASNGGGGIYTDGGRVDVVGGSITGNTAVEGSGSGGGVLNVGGEVTLTGTSVTGNRAARAGGGIEAAGGADGGDSATTLTGIVLAGNET
ncbi:MAG TPA: right-handed parallel beta-helix repeat-containing protein, partial [Mycobacteriales bacterium]|nr:right-handed parallel beta-helix repeat-containing protein [Mycobacteriales bacterium]